MLQRHSRRAPSVEGASRAAAVAAGQVRSTAKARAARDVDSWEGVDRGLFDELRRLRHEQAAAQRRARLHRLRRRFAPRHGAATAVDAGCASGKSVASATRSWPTTARRSSTHRDLLPRQATRHGRAASGDGCRDVTPSGGRYYPQYVRHQRFPVVPPRAERAAGGPADGPSVYPLCTATWLTTCETKEFAIRLCGSMPLPSNALPRRRSKPAWNV